MREEGKNLKLKKSGNLFREEKKTFFDGLFLFSLHIQHVRKGTQNCNIFETRPDYVCECSETERVRERVLCEEIAEQTKHEMKINRSKNKL